MKVVLALYVSMDVRFTKASVEEVEVSALRNVPPVTKQSKILRVETNASGVSIKEIISIDLID